MTDDRLAGGGRIGWADLRALGPLKARVLVVDDDPEVQRALIKALGAMGHEARAASSAEEADAWLSSEPFHLLLLDIDLPRMNGVEFLSWALRRDPELAVVMITGHDELELALRCMEAGARTYLVKPLEMRVLRSVVQDALAVRELLASYNRARRELL